MFYCTVYQPLTGVTLLTFTVLAGVGSVRCWGVCGEVTGFGAWCVCLVGGVAAMFISLIILKTSHNSTCDNLSNPLILISNYSESEKVYKATPDVVLDMLPGLLACSGSCWGGLGGLASAAGAVSSSRQICSTKLKVPKLCQDSAISLSLSLSISLVIAHIGVGSKICLGVLV